MTCIRKYFIIRTSILITIVGLMFTGCQNIETQNNPAPVQSAQSNPEASASDSNNTNSENSLHSAEKLQLEGYSEKDIESSELYVKRVILQLNEIKTFSSMNIHTEIAIGFENNITDDSIRYSELLSKIDDQKAVYYITRLKSDFHSLEEAIDEYLLALQLDLDVDTYFSEKNIYNEIRNEKMSGKNPDELITVKDIEEKALENLQKLNNSNKGIDQTVPGINNPNHNLGPDIINPNPDIPSVKIPQPIDPSQEIRDKLGPIY